MRCGYVTRKSAEENYGAVFEGDTLEIDAAPPKAKRDDMRAKGLPYDNPIAETLIPFAAPAAPERNPEPTSAWRRTAHALRAEPLAELPHGPAARRCRDPGFARMGQRAEARLRRTSG